MNLIVVAYRNSGKLHVPNRIVIRFDRRYGWRSLKSYPNESHECYGEYAAEHKHGDPDGQTYYVVDALGAVI